MSTAAWSDRGASAMRMGRVRCVMVRIRAISAWARHAVQWWASAARTQRDQLLASQLLDQAGVAGDDHTQQRLGVEFGAAEQAQFAQYRRTHLLSLIDEQHGPTARALQRWASQASRKTLKPAQRLCGRKETPKMSPISR